MNTYPLSESQLGIFYEWLQHPTLTDYNLPCLYQYSNRIDPDRLETALQKVFIAHPICYTRIVPEGKDIKQYIDTDQTLPIERLHVKEAELNLYVEKFVRPFNLYEDPLCRAQIIQTEQSVILLLDIHHIITDGMSMILLLKDLNNAYQGIDLVVEEHLFQEYAIAEKKRFGTDDYQIAARFYKDKFRGIPMTKIYGQPSEGVGYMRQISAFIPANTIDRYCEEQGITPNILFLAAYACTLSLFSREKVIAFYTVNHGRTDRRFRKSYGPFIKSVPMQITLLPESSVIDFIKSLKKETIHSVRYGSYPFTHFCKDLSVKPESSFAFQYNIEEKVTLGAEETILKALPKQHTNQNFSIVIYHLNGQYEIRLEYNDQRNTPYTMGQFLHSMEICLKEMQESPHKPLKEISYLSEEDKEELLNLVKGEPIPEFPKTFLDLFKEQVQRTPQKRAIVDHCSSLSYQELDQESDRIASHLLQEGVKANEFVGILLPREKEFMISVIGILKAGAAYLPLASDYPIERLRYMLEDSEAKVFITHEHLLNHLQGTGDLPSALCIKHLLKEETKSKTLPSYDPDQYAYMIYTSGSTGKPKGVVISHKALTAFIQACLHFYQLNSEDRIFCHSSFSFDASIEDLFPILTCGGELHILSDDIIKEPTQVASYITQQQLTGGNFTTQFGCELLRHYDLPLKYLTVGGERLNEIPKTKARFFNTYGPTEFTVDATFFEPIKGKQYLSIPIGRPTPNSCAYVLNEHSKLVPRGCVGELYLSGPQIANGYWKQEALTSDRFLPNPFSSDKYCSKMYRTGDLVKWNDQDDLEYIGRTDKQIKLRGFRIESGEIEASIKQCADISQAIVDVKNIHGVDHLCAYILSSLPIDKAGLRKQLKKRLAPYMIPSAFIQLEAFPLNANGKIDYTNLPLPNLQDETQYVAPESLEEKIMADIIQKLLEMDKISVKSDLFDLGLTSIQAIQAVFEAEESGIQTSVSKFYQSKNIRDILANKHSSLCYWGNDFQSDKPLLLIVCGYPYFKPFYDEFAKIVGESYSILVLESYNEYFFHKKDCTLEKLLDIYTRILQPILKDKALFGITGLCMGGEIGLQLAHRLSETGFLPPKVFVIDGFAYRQELSGGDELIEEPGVDFEINIERNRISNQLGESFFFNAYEGETHICLAKHFTKRLRFGNLPEETDPITIKQALERFKANPDLWKQLLPTCQIHSIDADHWSILQTKAAKEIKQIIDNSLISI